MSQETNTEDYLFIITEIKNNEESIVGMAGDDMDQFFPATKTKEEALVLMGRLPDEPGAERQVEAIHKDRLLSQAGAAGYRVFVVNMKGAILERLSPQEH